MKNFKRGTKWFYWFTLASAVVIIYKVLDNFTGISQWIGDLLKIVAPFLLAILVAYLFYIPCRKIEKLYKKNKLLKKKARGLSVLTVYILAILIMIILVNTLIPTLSESVMDLANNLPGYYDKAIEFVEELPENDIINKETIEGAIGKMQDINFAEMFTLDNISTYIKTAVGVANAIFNVFVTFVVSVYILLERTEILTFMRKLSKAMFSPKTYSRIDRYFIKGNSIFFKYISSQVIDAILVGVIMSVALSFMRVKYALLLGFMVGLFNLIPYFGAIIAVGLAVLITLFTGGISQAIWVLIVLIVLQQIDANIINPKIIGDALEISKILIIFAVTVAGAYFGVLGMFLGVPVIAVIKMMLDDYIENSETKNLA